MAALMHLVEIASSLIVLYGFYSFACFLITHMRRREVEIHLAHVGDRVSETTRRKLANCPPASSPSRLEVVRDPRFRRGGLAS